MSEPPQLAGTMSLPPPEGRPPRLIAPSERLACAVTHPAPVAGGQAVPPAAGTTATVARAGVGSLPTETTPKLGAPLGSCNFICAAVPEAWRVPNVQGRWYASTVVVG